MAANFQYSIQTASSPDKAKIVSCSGDIDESNYRILEECFEELFNDSKLKFVVFDLENLDYMNSKVIGVFVGWHSKFVESGKIFVFSQTKDHIFDIINLVGLTGVIECFDTNEEALLSFEN